MTSPRISVVTPLYNKAGAIERAVTSVIAQTCEEFEMIIVDDGSTDDGAERALLLGDPRVRVIRQPNQGAAAARNHGVRLARAAHIAFLDADDAWLPEFLATIVDLIARFPTAGAYATGYYIQNPGQRLREAVFDGVPEHAAGGLIESYFRVAADGRNPVWSSAVCIPRTTLQRVGGFPDGVRLYEDLHLWARIAIDYPLAYCARPLSVYYRDAENRRGPVARSLDDLSFADAIHAAQATGRLSPADGDSAARFVAHYTLLCAFKTLVAGRPRLARDIAATARARGWRPRARKYLVVLLSYMPARIVAGVWRVGKAIKSCLAAGRVRLASRG